MCPPRHPHLVAAPSRSGLPSSAHEATQSSLWSCRGSRVRICVPTGPERSTGLWGRSAGSTGTVNLVSVFRCSFWWSTATLFIYSTKTSHVRPGGQSGLLHQSKLILARAWAGAAAAQKGKRSVCVSPFRTSSSLFPAYSSSCFLLPGTSPPTQPRSDEVNNQGVSFKYQLAQWREPTCKERGRKKKKNPN